MFLSNYALLLFHLLVTPKTKKQKQYNRQLNQLRVVVEHVNRRLKIFNILSYRYRNPHRRFGLRANLIAGIYNYELAL